MHTADRLEYQSVMQITAQSRKSCTPTALSIDDVGPDQRQPGSGRWAVRAAVKLANELKLAIAIVIVDPDKVWKKEWGELYPDDGSTTNLLKASADWRADKGNSQRARAAPKETRHVDPRSRDGNVGA